MWEAIKDFIFNCINWFYGLTGDWGLAIICITVCFRIIIFPITRKQYISTYAMQKMSPKLKELQARYADDKQKLQEEQMKLYKEAKFNPLTSCLPMILQMPIFIALFQVLQELGARVGEGNNIALLGLVPNLTLSPSAVFQPTPEGIIALGPYVLLILLFGVSILIPTLLNKNTERQAKIMTYIMTAFMFYIGWISPAGVLVYWDVSSYIGVAQQIITTRVLKSRDEAAKAEEEKISKPTDIAVQRTAKKSKPAKKKKK
jgi:YidC/Oxa1 family membrane protein insertase